MVNYYENLKESLIASGIPFEEAGWVHLFQTESEFNSAYTGENYHEPWVSYTEELSATSFNKILVPCHHDYVEIGGIKWATMNLGATAVTDYGNKYYAWGETQGYTASQVGTDRNFTWADYELCDGTDSNMTKYNDTDGKTILEPVDDAVIAEWGGNWRMPTTEEWIALGEAVNTALTTDYYGSGVHGLVCTDKTDSSKVLFFPAAGECIGGGVYGVGDCGYFWSRSLTAIVTVASGMYFRDGEVYWNSNYDLDRFFGFSVRGILDD